MIRLLLIAVFFSSFLGASNSFADNREAVLKKELAYLVDSVPEIKWIKVERNTVYVGWDFPENISWFKILSAVPDFKMIVHAAARNGNNAIDFGVHIWSVFAKSKDDPGNAPHICSATARNGKIKNSDCK